MFTFTFQLVGEGVRVWAMSMNRFLLMGLKMLLFGLKQKVRFKVHSKHEKVLICRLIFANYSQVHELIIINFAITLLKCNSVSVYKVKTFQELFHTN
jgi:hypothetical protein